MADDGQFTTEVFVNILKIWKNSVCEILPVVLPLSGQHSFGICFGIWLLLSSWK